jgi:hypothetical protein
VSKRVDALIAKHPDHAEAIGVLASRDPAGNLKYLNWQMKVLLAGRALAPEIADVVEMFHQFGKEAPSIRPDLYSYRPQDFTSLRDALFVLQKARQRKQAKIDKRYKLVGDVDSEVVYESPALIVRLIKNKNASVRFGLGTKWCISMNARAYYEDYESENTTFFFISRKVSAGHDMDRVAAAYTRDLRNVPRRLEYYSAIDEPISELQIVDHFGPEFFDVQRIMYQRILDHPMSPTAILQSGLEMSPDALVAIYEKAKADAGRAFVHGTLLAIACNAGAPIELLRTLRKDGPKIITRSIKRLRGRRRWRDSRASTWRRDLLAAIYAHPALPMAERSALGKDLRRRNVRTASIEVTVEGDSRVNVTYSAYRGTFIHKSRWRQRRHRRLLRNSSAVIQRRLNWHKRGVIRLRKRLAKAKQRERSEAKKRQAGAKKRKAAKR